MRIFVKAKPNSKNELVEKISDNEFSVFIKEPPIQGRANAAIIKALAEYFKVAPSGVRIIFGYASKRKIIEID